MTQSLEPVRPDKQPYTLTPIQTAWVDFMSKFEAYYDLFVTLTFKQEIHPEEATKRYYRFVRKINEALFGRNYRKQGKGVVWVKALEFQKRGCVHFHCLIGNEVWKLLRIKVTDLWENDKKYKNSRNGVNGKAWVERYDPERGAKGYMGKYITKARQGEIDIFCPYYIRKHLGIIPDANRALSFLANNKHNLVVN